ncbi:MAG: hypothetical protein ACWA49_05985 [Ruegeria sp.]
MAKTLKDLLLALLNATLILVALCLFLGWKLAQSVENIQDNFRESLHIVQPLRDQAQGIREDLGGLRTELSGLRNRGDDDPETRQKLLLALTRLDQVQSKLESTQSRMKELADSPHLLIDYAINTAVDATTQRLIEIRGCGNVAS